MNKVCSKCLENKDVDQFSFRKETGEYRNICRLCVIKRHIDHIVPQSLLPYSSMEDNNFKKCWALENLRPLKSINNIRKSNKIFSEFYEST